MTFFSKITLAAAASIAVASPAIAQDYSLDPTYGTANLRTGFTPDPHTVRLRSGGSIDVSALNSACRGYVANAPDYRLNYQGGSSLPLIFHSLSNADTTLVINGPDGSWYCDDDSGEGLNPRLYFGSPPSGQYDIWVGTYGSTSTEAAELQITELTTVGTGDATAGTPDWTLDPTFGTANLRTGFTPDPYDVVLLSGGPIDAAVLGSNCNGFVARAPDFRLNYEAGNTLPLIISSASQSDTTLVINGPDESWYCDDDGGNNGLNPSLIFRNPQSGQYDIWVGTYGGRTNERAVLNISELYSD